MRSARFGFREEPKEKEEARASVMPSNMASIDPFCRPGEEVRRAVRDTIDELIHKTGTGGPRR